MKRLSRVAPGLAASLFVGSFVAMVQCGSTTTGSYSTGEDGGSSGGASTTGSSTGGSSGSSSGGGGSSSGGSAGGSSTGSSGSSSGGTGSSGAVTDSGPAEAGTSSGGPTTPAAVFGTKNGNGDAVVDSFVLFPCLEQDALNCKTLLSCPGGNGTWVDGQGLMSGNSPVGLQTHEYFQLGGTPGTTYIATIKVDGVSEGKGYTGGMRAAGNSIPTASPNGIDMFYVGGAPPHTGSDEDNYNIYELIVWNPPSSGTFQAPSGSYPGAAAASSALGSKVQNYFLNSFPDEDGADVTKSFDSTFAVSFTHTIQVPGGAIIEYATEDANCLAVDNCGLSGVNHNAPCQTGGIKIPNEPNVSLPQMYMSTSVSALNVVTASSQPYHSQAFHIQVTNVCVMGSAGCTEM